jgi:hypothetical protein
MNHDGQSIDEKSLDKRFVILLLCGLGHCSPGNLGSGVKMKGNITNSI